MQNDENGGMIMTILFKCDKVIRSMKNKIVKKGERKSMKKRKYLALLLAAGMIAQTALSTAELCRFRLPKTHTLKRMS